VPSTVLYRRSVAGSVTLSDREPTPEELEEALAYYKATLAKAPDDEIMWMLYGNALSAALRFEEAVAAYEKAAAGKRPLPEVHYLLGVARMSAGRYGAAVEAFETHLKRSEDIEVLVLASLCLDAEDDRGRSKAFFERAMRKDGPRAMEYLREYAQELVTAEDGEAPEGGAPEDAQGTREGLKAAIGHINEYLKENKDRRPLSRGAAQR
jgi:tetratricopeptide (TPR) repeat protein